jgi:hypothetical protein
MTDISIPQVIINKAGLCPLPLGNDLHKFILFPSTTDNPPALFVWLPTLSITLLQKTQLFLHTAEMDPNQLKQTWDAETIEDWKSSACYKFPELEPYQALIAYLQSQNAKDFFLLNEHGERYVWRKGKS